MVSKVTKKIDLNQFKEFKQLTPVAKDEAKQEIGDFVKESILDNTGEAKTSVAGGRWKKSLSPEYKEIKSKLSGSTVANMELTGDMLDTLEAKPYRNGVEVGIFDEDEAQKADNHNKFSAKSRGTKLPPREFIPRKDTPFKRDIVTGMKEIIKEIHDVKENRKKGLLGRLADKVRGRNG